MLNYKFPVIKHLDDVLWAVRDKPNITLSARGEYYVLAYDYSFHGAFSWNPSDPLKSALIRECRGLVFNANGDLISRPYHKFFNVGEYQDVSEEEVVSKLANTPCDVLDKIDGSMIHVVDLYGSMRLFTKRGASEVAFRAEEYFDELIANDKGFLRSIQGCLEDGLTPIFEWTSPRDQIVVRYTEPSLTLTAIRNRETGEYYDYNQLMKRGHTGLVTSYINWERDYHTIETFSKFVDNTKKFERNQEGYVLRFLDGHMVKIKCDWYMLYSNTFDVDKNERNVLKMVLDQSIDDVISSCTEDRAKRLRDYSLSVSEWIEAKVANAWDIYNHVSATMSVKEFSLSVSDTLDVFDRAMVFSLYQHKNPVAALVKLLGKQAQTLTDFEEFKRDQNFPSLWEI